MSSLKICDLCNKSCRPKYLTDQDVIDYGHDPMEYAELKAHWGYDSDGRDLQEHHAYICQPCYENLLIYIKNQGGKVNINYYGLFGDEN